MKRSLFIALAATLYLLISCTAEIDQTVNESRSYTHGPKVVFHASTEGPSTPSTKVYADSKMKVLWNEGDQITIFNKITYNHGFEFDGEDGDTAGGFTQFTEISSPFVTWADLDNVYAVYPYSTKTKIDNEGVMTVALPSEQTYKVNSFGIGANTMVAVTDDNFLAFKNVGGYLSLRLYGDDVSVSRITIKGNNGEKLAGKASIEMPLGGVPTVTMDNSATDEISVVCNPAVKIGEDANSYTDFWFVIPPVYFSLGFTITVTDDKGGIFERATSKALTINRNTLEWMAALKVVPDYTNANVPFEDANFKAYCVENFDRNGDGEISYEEALLVTCIHCNNSNIQSLSGIECFTNLTYLYCSSNHLTSLDVSHNTQLRDLHCDDNQLTSLEVSHNTSLISLRCHLNQLTSLDVSHNTKLTDLYCYSNQLNSLDVNNCTKMTSLWCYSNQLTNLDVSHNTKLTDLYCYSNQLTCLDVSHNTALTSLLCNSNQLTSLDVCNNASLKYLVCFSNQLTSLDVSHNLALKMLECQSNPALTEIWLKTGQVISTFNYDTNVATIKYIPEAVDLGLSVKWASFNLGASAPEGYGDFYAWGETTPKDNYDISTYKWHGNNTYTKYGTVDNKTVLDLSDDAARANWGGNWRMPTDADWTELWAECTTTWTTQNGTNGRLVTGPNGNSIFLPATGYRKGASRYDIGSVGNYWSSSLHTSDQRLADYAYFHSGGVGRQHDYRYYGQSVRPVTE